MGLCPAHAQNPRKAVISHPNTYTSFMCLRETFHRLIDAPLLATTTSSKFAKKPTGLEYFNYNILDIPHKYFSMTTLNRSKSIALTSLPKGPFVSSAMQRTL